MVAAVVAVGVVFFLPSEVGEEEADEEDEDEEDDSCSSSTSLSAGERSPI